VGVAEAVGMDASQDARLLGNPRQETSCPGRLYLLTPGKKTHEEGVTGLRRRLAGASSPRFAAISVKCNISNGLQPGKNGDTRTVCPAGEAVAPEPSSRGFVLGTGWHSPRGGRQSIC